MIWLKIRYSVGGRAGEWSRVQCSCLNFMASLLFYFDLCYKTLPSYVKGSERTTSSDLVSQHSWKTDKGYACILNSNAVCSQSVHNTQQFWLPSTSEFRMRRQTETLNVLLILHTQGVITALLKVAVTFFFLKSEKDHYNLLSFLHVLQTKCRLAPSWSQFPPISSDALVP